MFESPYLNEVIQMGIAQRLPQRLDEVLPPAVADLLSRYEPDVRARCEAEVRAWLEARIYRGFIQDALEVRFGEVPADRLATVEGVRDRARLVELHWLAVTCPSLQAFFDHLTGARP